MHTISTARGTGTVLGVVALSLLLALPVFADTFPQLVSVASDGTQGNSVSTRGSISADARYVAFESRADNLVPGDTNNASSAVGTDIFVHDRLNGITSRVNVASDGTQANGDSQVATISADGRYVAFVSSASNLVAGDSNAQSDVFLHDTVTGTTSRVSVASDGSQGNANSSGGTISANGRYVVFISSASNLVAGDTNGAPDAFVHDRLTGTTIRVDVASDGSQGNGGVVITPTISSDGRYVVFISTDSSLVPGDTNGAADTFVHDLVTGSTSLASVASDGSQGNSSSDGKARIAISADGRYVAFASFASNLVPNDTNAAGDIAGEDVFVHDMMTGVTTRVDVASDGSQGNADRSNLSMSADGRYVAFSSAYEHFVTGDTNGVFDTFVHDMSNGSTVRVSVAADGSQAGGGITVALSDDGQYIVFDSSASNVVQGDTNAEQDVFITPNPLFVTPNHAPVLTPIGNRTVGENQTLTFTVSATDSDQGDIITLSANNLPSGASFDSQTGTFSWTPTYEQAGTYPSVTFVATDNGSPVASSSQSISITVNNTNRAPTFDGYYEVQAVNLNSPLQFTVSATDPDGDAVTLSASGLPYGATFDAQAGEFSWTPTSTPAAVKFVLSATDNGNPIRTTSIDIWIYISGIPIPPLELTTIADSFLREGAQNRNEGANPHLFVQTSGHNRSLVAFDYAAITNYINSHGGLTSAKLVLTIAENGTGWGASGRTIDAHRLTEGFAEGNGKDSGLPNNQSTRGTGEGATWNCATDILIQNQNDDCSTQWNGGTFAAATAPSVTILNNQTGEMEWDVTQDVLNNSFQWLIKKTSEAQAGGVEFYSREGAADAGNSALAPRLILIR